MPSTPGTRLDVRILGPLEVLNDGNTLPLGTPKMRDLFALLVLDAGRAVPVDVLIEQLWDEPPSDASGAIQGYVYRLRNGFGDARDVLVTRGPSYLVDVEPDAIDAFRFEQGARTGRSLLADGRPADAADALRDALALWRGSALQDVGGTRAEAEAMRLNELRLAVLEDRIEADLALGDASALAGELEALTAAHPLRERFHAQRMRALYRAGRQADALAVYAKLRERLADDLGLDPGAELRELEQAILRQDASLDTGVSAAASESRVRVSVTGPSPADLDLTGGVVTIGRAPGNHVVLDDPLVSGTHAVLERLGAAWSLRDLGSRNGTFVNGVLLIGERVIGADDEVKLGSSSLRFSVTTPAVTPTIGVVQAPELTELERSVAIELCRPVVDGGAVPGTGEIATALGVDATTIEATLDALATKFGVPARALDLLAVQALESGAVTVRDLRR